MSTWWNRKVLSLYLDDVQIKLMNDILHIKVGAPVESWMDGLTCHKSVECSCVYYLLHSIVFIVGRLTHFQPSIRSNLKSKSIFSCHCSLFSSKAAKQATLKNNFEWIQMPKNLANKQAIRKKKLSLLQSAFNRL